MKNIPNNKYFIETWGCQMNKEDSEKLSGMLKNLGYNRTEDKYEASIIIFNTCCVRENAEFKVYGNLGILKGIKEKNKNIIIAVCGCMMQQEGMAKNIIKKYPFVDIIFGTHNSYKFPEYLYRAKQETKSIIEIANKEEGIVEGVPLYRGSAIKAYVTIMYGCNNFCSYCVVPYVRGRERSRNPIDIENEIKTLVASGYKEITLLGQNVNSYGKGLEDEIDFSDLLKRINNIEGIGRIRFMTSHPKDLSLKVIKTIAKCDKLCEQIHLPVQSGSDRILKIMNRQYDKQTYLNLTKEIRKNIPNCSISTDLIIGFPGETEEDFLETLDLVEKVKFDSVYTFIYSKRKGTPADEMLNQVEDSVKHMRFNRLVAVINKICIEKNKEYENLVCEVLVEDYSKNDPEKLMGRTKTGKQVNFPGDSRNIGKLINVKITKALSFSLNGIEI